MTNALTTTSNTDWEILEPETEEERFAREIPRLERAIVQAPRGSKERAELVQLLREIEVYRGRVYEAKVVG